MAASLLLNASGCGGGGAGPGEARRAPAAVQVVSGGAQVGVVGQQLAEPVLVRVVDAQGQPVQGQLVNFHVTSGGGAVFAGASISNASGQVQERWTLGSSTSQAQTLEARAVDNDTGAPIVFAVVTATPVADVPASIQVVSGDDQRVAEGAAVTLPLPLVASVLDQYGNPATGAVVEWVVASGDAVEPTSSTVDASGQASTAWTLDATTGQHGLTARTNGHSVAFVANRACPTSSVKLAPGGLPACTGANAVQAGAQVIIGVGACPRCDEEGLSCLVTLPGAGDNIIQLDVLARVCTPSTSCPTGCTGTPVDCRFQAPSTPGTYQLLIADPSLGVVQQLLEVVASGGATTCGTTVGGPALLRIVAGNDQSGVAGDVLPVPLRVEVTDRGGSPLAGVEVTFAVTGGGGALSTLTATTDAAGLAETSWTPGPASGLQRVVASVPGLTSVTFVGTATPGVVIRGGCTPPAPSPDGSCLFASGCATFHSGRLQADVASGSSAGPLVWPFQLDNQRMSTADPGTGRVETAFAVVQHAHVRYLSAALTIADGDYATPPQPVAPGGGTTVVLLSLIPAGLAGSIADQVGGTPVDLEAEVMVSGTFGDGVPFETAPYRVPIAVCDGCLADPAVTPSAYCAAPTPTFLGACPQSRQTAVVACGP